MYIENSQQIERKIILQDQEITPLFDTPYLIKGIRNYRITKDISPTLRETSCLWSLEKSGAHKILAGSSPTLTQYVPTLEKNFD
jgi:hypothetical protein